MERSDNVRRAWIGMGVAGLVCGLAAQTRLVSAIASGGVANSSSQHAALALGGTLVAFDSLATDLVPADTNAHQDVFVLDRAQARIVRVSVATNGAQGDGPSYAPSFSFDGRYVAFVSAARNLAGNDGNGALADVFVHDRVLGTTELASLSSAGLPGDGACRCCALSGDGRYVIFESEATNLVPGDQNGASDVFVRDRQLGRTTCVSLSAVAGTGNAGSRGASLSADGRIATFTSFASDLVAHDLNGAWDVFVRDLALGRTERVSVATGGTEADGPSESASTNLDGRLVAFVSAATNLCAGDGYGSWDVFVHDRATGTTTRVVEALGGGTPDFSCYAPSLSPDGGYVAFESDASDLVPGDTNRARDVFVTEVATKRVRRVSVGGVRVQSNRTSEGAAVAWGGATVAFTSWATNLAPDDPNLTSDVFVRHWVAASVEPYGDGWRGAKGVPTLSALSAPVHGRDILLGVGNASGTWTLGALLYGDRESFTSTGFGGALLVDPRLRVPLLLPPGGTRLAVCVPEYPDAIGLVCCMQLVHLDTGASHAVAFSLGLRCVLGE